MFHVLIVSVAEFMDSTGEIPFMFKKAGCQVDIFCSEKSWLRSNSFHDNWIETGTDPAAFSRQLLDLVTSQLDKYNWIVLLEDPVIKLMNESIQSEELFKKILPLTKIENREILSSKAGLSKACGKYNIDTPKNLNYSELHSAAEINEKLAYPILLKVDHSFAGTGIQYCETPAEMAVALDKVTHKDNLVIQEFIKGDDIGVEALFKDGELVTYNAAHVLCYMYSKFSFTTRRNYFRNEILEGLLRTLGQSLGLNGFASINYIYHPERKIYYLIEVDARTNSWMPYSRFTGNSFIDGIKQIVEGRVNTTSNKKTDNNKVVEVAIFDRDIRRCMKFKDYKGIMQWVFNYKGFWRFIPLYDKVLFKRIMTKMIKDLFKIKY